MRWLNRDPIEEKTFVLLYNHEDIPQSASTPFGTYVLGDEGYDPVLATGVDQVMFVNMHNGGALYLFLSNDPMNLLDFLGLVDLNKFPAKEKIKGYADKAKTSDGSFSVGAHGTSTKIVDEYGKAITPKSLAKEILEHPSYTPGQAVTLASCNTGKGSNSYARRLADELSKQSCKATTVRAPDDFVWYNSAGKVWPAGKDPLGKPGAKGGWRKFIGELK